jgi:hypothetical protein
MVAVKDRQSLLDHIFKLAGFPLGLERPTTMGTAHEAQTTSDPVVCQALHEALGWIGLESLVEAHVTVHVSNLALLPPEVAAPSPIYVNTLRGVEPTLMRRASF